MKISVWDWRWCSASMEGIEVASYFVNSWGGVPFSSERDRDVGKPASTSVQFDDFSLARMSDGKPMQIYRGKGKWHFELDTEVAEVFATGGSYPDGSPILCIRLHKHVPSLLHQTDVGLLTAREAWLALGFIYETVSGLVHNDILDVLNAARGELKKEMVK